jgi:hypothetical protein
MRGTCDVYWANSTDACTIAIETFAFLIRKAHCAFALFVFSGSFALALLILRACARQASVRFAFRIIPASDSVAAVYAQRPSMAVLLLCAVPLIANPRVAIVDRSTIYSIAPACGDIWE